MTTTIDDREPWDYPESETIDMAAVARETELDRERRAREAAGGDDEGPCGACNGSGEGPADGTTCPVCR
jgi:hypothetical protein